LSFEICQCELPPRRDLRLDAIRGIALWFIFIDHIPDNVCHWLTMLHYGFSDTTEVFMFVSGVTCALAYREVQRCDGWWAVISHTLRRGWEIYLAFLMLVVGLAVLVYWAGGGALADDANVRVFLEQPGEAMTRAMLLQYRPVNTDVLPNFVLFHVLFAPLLWMLLKIPKIAFWSSALLYLLIQLYGWNLPGWPHNPWYFNPFAWQFLVVIGAWWVMTGRSRFRPLLVSGPVVALAAAYVVFALVVTLSWSFEPLQALIPPFLAKLIYPIDKPDLDPLRLMHVLSIAVLVARFVPQDWRGLSAPWLRGAVRCGENSLEIYCLSVLLSLIAHVFLTKVAGGVPAQIAVSAVGIALLTAFATLTTWIGIGSQRQARLF
jgi:hypothetical protein